MSPGKRRVSGLAWSSDPLVCNSFRPYRLSTASRISSLLIILCLVAAAAIMLGLLPTLLSLLGSTTTEYGLVSIRRPLFSLLIGLGSPAVSPLRTEFEDIHVQSILYGRPHAIELPKLRAIHLAILAVFQYLFACAAAGNVIHTMAELGFRAICSIASERLFLPGMWNGTNLLVLCLGIITLRKRVVLQKPPQEPSLYRPKPQDRLKAALLRWVSKNSVQVSVHLVLS